MKRSELFARVAHLEAKLVQMSFDPLQGQATLYRTYEVSNDLQDYARNIDRIIRTMARRAIVLR